MKRRINLLLIMLGIFITTSCANNTRALIKQNESDETEQIHKPVSFDEDNWATLCSVANMGKDFFKKTYLKNGELNELLGKTRSVHVNGVGECIATVIGVEHDLNSNDEKGLLTFSIDLEQKVITNYSDFTNRWYLEKGETTEEARLRKVCNGVYNALQNSVKENIIPVKKTTIEYNSSYKEVNHTIEKVFPLSISEYGLIEDTTEGIPYEAYTSKKASIPTEILTRSINTRNQNESLIINENKEIECKEVSYIMPYSPCFTIGIQRNVDINISLENCTSTIETKISGLSGTQKEFTVKPNQGYALPSTLNFPVSLFEVKYEKGSELLSDAKITFLFPSVPLTISCVAGLAEYKLTVNLTNITSNAPVTYIATTKVSFKITPASGFRYPDTITFSNNIKDGEYNPKTGAVSFTGPVTDCSITANGRNPATLDPVVSIDKSNGNISYSGGASSNIVSCTTDRELKYNNWVNQRTDLWLKLIRNSSTDLYIGLFSGPSTAQATFVKTLSKSNIIKCESPAFTVNWTIKGVLDDDKSDTHRYVCNKGEGDWYFQAGGVEFWTITENILYYEQSRTTYYDYFFKSITWQKTITYEGRTLNLSSGQGGTNAHYVEVEI